MSLSSVLDRKFKCNRCKFDWREVQIPGECPRCGTDDFTEINAAPNPIQNVRLRNNAFKVIQYDGTVESQEFIRDLIVGFGGEVKINPDGSVGILIKYEYDSEWLAPGSWLFIEKETMVTVYTDKSFREFYEVVD